jgi:hypothetical protein
MTTLKPSQARNTRPAGQASVRIDPVQSFHSHHYLRHNARRLEHLASLRIPVRGKTVLEVGAGIGDHSSYYIDRGCTITITEERSENLRILESRYPDHNVHYLDMDHPQPVSQAPFDVVHCYGLLYHLSQPLRALTYLSECCRRVLILETCVSFGDQEAIHCIAEDPNDPTQAASGTGCRPTRPWIFATLKRLFPHVYVPTTQPNHEEFPLDWTKPEDRSGNLHRAIFIGSRTAIESDVLVPELIDRHVRHD